jgi:hypothetical protein
MQHGLDPALLMGELFANRISAFFGLDVLVSALALFVFIRIEGSRQGIRKRWIPVLAVLVVGLSLGLPLFLYMREIEIEASAHA